MGKLHEAFAHTIFNVHNMPASAEWLVWGSLNASLSPPEREETESMHANSAVHHTVIIKIVLQALRTPQAEWFRISRHQWNASTADLVFCYP